MTTLLQHLQEHQPIKESRTPSPPTNTTTHSDVSEGPTIRRPVSDDRSPLSSGAESDDSSDIDEPGATNLNSSGQNAHDALKATSLAHFSSANNAIYSSSGISQIPQEILLGLVQSGHLQLHTEEDGNQLGTIPISMTASSSGQNSGGGISTNSGNQGRNRSNKNSRSQVKDLSTKGNKNSSANGRPISPKVEITIKEEMFD